MITITKQNDGVLFTFENSDKYLYGNGSILVPFNTLSIVADESDMITLKKAASNDVFLSARYDTDFGYRSKDDAIDELKGMLFAETGGGGGSESGITSGEVQTMIDNSLEDYYTDDEVDAALSGKAGTSDVTAVANDVQTVSGQVQTKVATSDFNAYSAATATALGNKADASALTAHADNANVHFSGTQKSNYDNLEGQYYADDSWDIMPQTVFNDFTNDYSVAMGQFDQRISANTSAITELKSTKLDASAYTPTDLSEYWTSAQTQSAIDGVNNVLTAHTANTTIHVTAAQTEAWNAKANIDHVTQAEYSAMEQTGTLDSNTMYIIDDAVAFDPSTKVDVSAITTAITSGSTDSEIPTAKATYDAIQAGGGGGATYSAGQGISIDTANTISFAVPIYSGATGNVFHPTYNNNSILIGNSNNRASITSVAGGNACTGQSFSFVYGASNNATGSTSVAIGNRLNAINDREAAFGTYNVSNKANTTFGDSGNTLFSVGNGTGTGTNANHNAFEIRQNGDIYVNDGTNDVKLQDTITATTANTTALGGLKLVKLSQSDYDNLATKDPDTLYIISNVVS